MESAQKAAGVMLNSDSKEDALKMIEMGSVSDPMLQLCYIGYEFGKRAAESDKLEKMFSTNVLDTQESV